ncbi:MAG: hypothetical protein ACRC33_04525 [Gemmataceae bacterium]
MDQSELASWFALIDNRPIPRALPRSYTIEEYYRAGIREILWDVSPDDLRAALPPKAVQSILDQRRSAGASPAGSLAERLSDEEIQAALPPPLREYIRLVRPRR